MKIEYCTYFGTSKIQHMEFKMEFRWNFEVLYNTLGVVHNLRLQSLPDF